jgi:hypothetical protein
VGINQGRTVPIEHFHTSATDNGSRVAGAAGRDILVCPAFARVPIVIDNIAAYLAINVVCLITFRFSDR